MAQFNPYQSPRASLEHDCGLVLPVLPSTRWHEIDVRVASAVRGWYRRRIRLTGSIVADIEYNPVGVGERVYVNGRLIVTTSGRGRALVEPHIDFYLEALQHAVPANIDVRASCWRLLRTVTFRLTIAGKTVYEE